MLVVTASLPRPQFAIVSFSLQMDTERVEADTGVASAVGEAAAAPAPPAAYVTTVQLQSDDVSATATGKVRDESGSWMAVSSAHVS